jgi:hypothetical protein
MRRFVKTVSALTLAGIATAGGVARADSCHDLVATESYECKAAGGGAPLEIGVSFDATGQTAVTQDGLTFLCTCSSTGRSVSRLVVEAGQVLTCSTLPDGVGNTIAFTAGVRKKSLTDGTLAFIKDGEVDFALFLTCTEV